ncbi:MAG: guanylate kinase [Bacteroidetes bacterium]|nr:guanylate kinase [Bacteroidota bacterium]MBL6944242.1 guanylate kinase [Bacteroidales bacterium]
MAVNEKKGKLLIFSAPSGSGKTTLVKYLMEHLGNLSFSVSATSRKKRSNEINGKDYYFLTVDEFRRKIKSNEFVEWEEVYKDSLYGTLKSEVERIRNTGKNVVFDIDVVGGLNIKKLYGDDALAIFVMPPSVEVLKTRLESRGTDNEKEIATRLAKAEYELSFSDKFDTIIINDDFKKAKEDTVAIIEKFIK